MIPSPEAAQARATPLSGSPRPRVVLAAIDIRDPRSSLPKRVLRAGERLARAERAELQVAFAWTLVGESILSCPIRGISPEKLKWLRAQAQKVWLSRVEALCAEVLQHEPSALHVRHGDPRVVVPALARRVGAGLVVIGRHDRAGIHRFLGRGFVHDALARTGCDLLELRPPDSPVAALFR